MPGSVKVSVVIPSFNHGRFLGQCLRSVFAQSMRDLEIVVVDDGSKDESRKILESEAKSSPVPIRLEFQKNQGAHAAINRGIALSSGEYINILNSDDYFSEDRLERMLAEAERSRAQLLFSKVVFVDERSRDIGRRSLWALYMAWKQSRIHSFPTVGYALLDRNVAVSSGNFFVSRQLCGKVGPFNDYKHCHDWDFALRCVLFTEPRYVDSPTYFYRLHSENSFRSLASVGAQEMPEVVSNFFLKAATAPPVNDLAPSASSRPFYFNFFLLKTGYCYYLPSWRSAAVRAILAHLRAKRDAVLHSLADLALGERAHIAKSAASRTTELRPGAVLGGLARRALAGMRRATPAQAPGEFCPPLPPRKLISATGSPTAENFLAIGNAWAQLVSSRLRPSSTVLDIGCGCARTARALIMNPSIERYVGFDVSKESIEWDRRVILPLAGKRFQFLRFDIYSRFYNPRGRIKAETFSFPAEEKSVDLAFAASLFTHLLEPDAAHYLREIRRVLTERGQAIISLHITPAAGRDYSGNEYRIDVRPDYFISMARQAGLEVAESLGDFWGQEVFVFKRRSNGIVPADGEQPRA